MATAINSFSVKVSSRVQGVLSTVKCLILVTIIVTGAIVASSGKLVRHALGSSFRPLFIVKRPKRSSNDLHLSYSSESPVWCSDVHPWHDVWKDAGGVLRMQHIIRRVVCNFLCVCTTKISETVQKVLSSLMKREMFLYYLTSLNIAEEI